MPNKKLQFNNVFVSAHSHLPLANFPVIALAGPTASGKTAAALALAKHLAPKIAVEIISVDSALVYLGMDIGTAKPSAQERAAVVHHLIDIRDPLHAYSAADFSADAQRLITQIRERQALPVLVGGTMLYFKALWDGLDPLPPANASYRAQLEQEAVTQGWPALHAQLAHIDPLTAARLQPQDAQRIQRALEVFRITGQAMSSFHTGRKNTNPALADALLFSLEPSDRSWLHTRIAQRFDALLAAGFIEEVQTLRRRGDLHLNLPSMRCVGYRQAWEMLDGGYSAAEMRERGIIATRQLAKRQITWLRSMPQRRIIACDGSNATAQFLAQVDAHLKL